MKKFDLPYFIGQGFRSILTHRLMSLASISVMTACLLLLGAFAALTVNIENVLTTVEDQNEIVAYVEDGVNDELAADLSVVILKNENVETCTFVSRDQAMKEYKEKLGDYATVLDGIGEDNPLRHRYRITLRDLSRTQVTANEIAEISGIANVEANVNISSTLVSIRYVVSFVCVILVVVLFIVSIFIISNTINLAMFNRREEIAIMKMVGATNWFIRWPFIIEGVLLGLLGALLALGLEWALYWYIGKTIAEALPVLTLIPFKQLAPALMYSFFATGFVVGVGGSALTMKKFLKV